MTTNNKAIIITVDGYSSCGKSTFAKAIAKKLNYIFVDSGAMYRACTLFFIDNGGIKDGIILRTHFSVLLDKINIRFKYNQTTSISETWLNEINVEEAIRSRKDISDNVSIIASEKAVREKMVELQRRMGHEKGIVMDGRDIGTVVFPNAELKIFMTADPDIRVQRRYDELRSKGICTTFKEVKDGLVRRDYIDETRAESPLRKPDNAIILDNSKFTKEQQMEWIIPIIESRMNS